MSTHVQITITLRQGKIAKIEAQVVGVHGPDCMAHAAAFLGKPGAKIEQTEDYYETTRPVQERLVVRG